jgi:hypothetical protein
MDVRHELTGGVGMIASAPYNLGFHMIPAGRPCGERGRAISVPTAGGPGPRWERNGPQPLTPREIQGNQDELADSHGHGPRRLR